MGIVLVIMKLRAMGGWLGSHGCPVVGGQMRRGRRGVVGFLVVTSRTTRDRSFWSSTNDLLETHFAFILPSPLNILRLSSSSDIFYRSLC